ncbi:hypothetical protein WHX55_13130 [Pseudomonas fluorescens]|uniref:hypothetical protein n=1 Tax=Pseudomonas fluorescens TaxID=294 RepID=UPI0032560E9D
MTQINTSETISTADELKVLHSLVREWVEIGWRHGENEPFNFKGRLERFYDWTSADTQFFDNFDSQRRINKTVAEYAAIWDIVVPQMRTLTNRMVGEPNTLISGDLAVMDVQFVTSFETSDGVTDQANTLSSLVWRRTLDSWRIIREHGTALAVGGA